MHQALLLLMMMMMMLVVWFLLLHVTVVTFTVSCYDGSSTATRQSHSLLVSLFTYNFDKQ